MSNSLVYFICVIRSRTFGACEDEKYEYCLCYPQYNIQYYKGKNKIILPVCRFYLVIVSYG